MTGDVTINPTASCLVMTTEVRLLFAVRFDSHLDNRFCVRCFIVAQKLCERLRGSYLTKFTTCETKVGYARSPVTCANSPIERGVVWEETLILLPDTVRFVFLSATIPNAKQFAEWICKVHEQPCHVVYTDFRPTPLQHYLFPGGEKVYILLLTKRASFERTIFKRQWAFSLIQRGRILRVFFLERDEKGDRGKVTRKVRCFHKIVYERR